MKKLGKVYILGDSYSTFEGCIPKGYDTWYSSAVEEKSDVRSKEHTWWCRLLKSTESNLILNDSFSGTTICNITYNGVYCPDTSFIGRFDKRLEEKFFDDNIPDTFFLFGGTNDSWANSSVGKLKYENWNKEDLNCVLPAFCFLLNKIKTNLPSTRTVIIINTELKQKIADGFVTACKHYGFEYIELQNIDKTCGHPNKNGMVQIFIQIFNML